MNRSLVFGFLFFTIGTCSWGQGLMYHPLNPAFGGNTFNYSWLQSSAQAQDRTVDPTAKRNQNDFRTQTSSLENFSQSLQNQLLSRITRSLVDSKFGEGELKEGTYNLGDFQVEIRNGTDGFLVRIVDGKGAKPLLPSPISNQ